MSLYTIIHDWIVSVSGYPAANVIRGFQTGPRPTPGDYATYYILTTVNHDYSIEQREDLDNGDDDIRVHFIKPKEIMITVDVYALNGHQVLADLGQSNELLATRQILSAENFVLQPGGGNAQSLTGLGDTEYRDRYNGTFTLGTYNELSEENQKILQIVMSGDIGGLESTITVGG